MRAKEYLQQFGMYEERIERKLAEVYKNRVLAENMAVAFGEDKVQSSGSGDRTAAFAANIVDCENDIAQLLTEYGKFSREALSRLERMCLLGETCVQQFKVLHMRFVERLSFDAIADETHYSQRHVFNLYNQGLVLFEELYL